jgi:hypothetical protein
MKKFNTILFLILFPMLIFSWWSNTHKLLSAYACINSKLIKENLMWKFNLDMGAAQPLTVKDDTKTVSGWIYDGAEKEDAGNILLLKDRSGRHFHNPLKIFSEAGLMRVIEHVQSSILWAQDSVEQDKFDEGDMSWQKVKEYYLNALISDTEEKRHLNFGLMFKGLGHQIHLVQDMSNPEHTRNDNHPAYTIERWAEHHANDIIEEFCKTPLFPNVDLKTFVEDSSTGKSLFPIARLTDADVYVPENPVPSATLQQGLAEYSNANFFSDDTIFTIDFPYPSLVNADISKIFTKINTEYKPDEKGVYLPKTNEGDPINHFLRLPYLKKYTTTTLLHLSYLDELCYKDYTSMLIPRTVGYSAALINYFFRGEIEVTLPASDGIYSFCFVPAEGFKKISVMAKNISPDNEEMKNGHVSLIVSYRMGSSTPFVLNPPKPEVERFFKKIDYINPIDPKDPDKPIDIPRDNPIRLDFDLTSSPLSTDAVDVTLTVVFKGDLGAELTEAVAIGFKDISEPTPIDLYNNTDKVCFNGNYVNYNDPALWAVVDVNPQNGKIDCLCHAEIDITRKRIGQETKGVYVYFSFNGKPANKDNYYFKYDDGWEIPPGETPYRFFVLADAFPAEFNYSILVRSIPLDKEGDICFFYYFPNTVYLNIPYTNKLEWVGSSEPDNCYYEHIHMPLTYTFGFLHGIFNYYEGGSVPEDSICSASSSESSFSSTQSKNNASLATPRNYSVLPIKKLE